MLALFCMTKVAWAVHAAATGANDTHADAGFVSKAVTTGQDEAAASTTAVRMTASRALKAVAKIISADLREVSDQLLEIARAKGLPIPARHASGNEQNYASGNEQSYSDAAFIEREIKSHLEAIALYEDEASSSDAQLRAFAQRILPQLQRHLALLRSLKSGK